LGLDLGGALERGFAIMFSCLSKDEDGDERPESEAELLTLVS